MSSFLISLAKWLKEGPYLWNQQQVCLQSSIQWTIGLWKLRGSRKTLIRQGGSERIRLFRAPTSWHQNEAKQVVTQSPK